MEHATAAAGAQSGARGLRRQRSARTTLLGVVAAVLAGCLADPGMPAERQGASVVGGQAEAGYPAVGYLLVGANQGNLRRACGATAIAPNAAVTAAHCTVGSAVFGMGFGNGGDEHVARTAVVHPNYDPNGAQRYRHDVAVLLFDEDLGANLATIADGPAGTDSRYIGYGRTTPGDYEVQDGYTFERKSAAQWIEDNDGLSVWTTGVDGGLCWGDSGGPLMIEGTNQVIGVLADFNQVFDCQVGNRMIFTSLAGEREFIDGAIAGNGGGQGGGGGGGDDGAIPDEWNGGGDWGGGGACQHDCATYGYAAGQCSQGWYCDGACVEYTGCNDGGGGGGGGGGGDDWDGGGGGPFCEFACQDYGYTEGQCNEGWFCSGGCVQFTGCGFGGGGGAGGFCEYACADYGYAVGQCWQGWYCDGVCLSWAGCGF